MRNANGGIIAQLARHAADGVGPRDPAAFAGAMAALILLVATAAYIPARRALGIQPARALREM